MKKIYLGNEDYEAKLRMVAQASEEGVHSDMYLETLKIDVSPFSLRETAYLVTKSACPISSCVILILSRSSLIISAVVISSPHKPTIFGKQV